MLPSTLNGTYNTPFSLHSRWARTSLHYYHSGAPLNAIQDKGVMMNLAAKLLEYLTCSICGHCSENISERRWHAKQHVLVEAEADGK